MTPKNKKRKVYGFDPAFEQDFITALCMSREMYDKVGASLVPARFSTKQGKICLASLQWLIKKTGAHPSGISPILQRIELICNEERKIKPEEAEAAKEWLRAKAAPELLLSEESLLKTASIVLKSIILEDVRADIEDGDDVPLAGLIERVQAADSVGEASTSPGLDWNDPAFIDAFLDLPPIHRIPFGIPALDECTEGGYGKGHFSLILAGTNAGKSFFLINLAVYAACLGYNVILPTLEMNEQDTYARILSCLTGVPLTLLMTDRNARQLALNRQAQIKASIPLGSIKVKFFDANTGIESITGWVETEEKTSGKVYDVVVVDYMDKVGSKRNSRRMDNSYVTYGDIFEFFRIWCLKKGKYGVSASQSKNLMSGNKRKNIKEEGANEKSNPVLCPEDVADSLNKSRVVDLIIGLTASYMSVVKNRHGPVGGIIGEFDKATAVGCVHPDYVEIGLKMAGLSKQ